MQIAHEFSIEAQKDRTRRWDLRFLVDAMVQARRSKDPSTKVGAVIIRPDLTTASQGYNGFPRGVYDTDERLNHRPTKYAMVVHAEANAIVTAKEPLTGYTIYTAPLPPCSVCAGLVIQSGIKRAVAIEPDEDKKQRWAESLALTQAMFDEAGVSLTLYPESEVVEQALSDGIHFISSDEEDKVSCGCCS
jgi:dCMP deaminase